jgi:hypothetical protein
MRVQRVCGAPEFVSCGECPIIKVTVVVALVLSLLIGSRGGSDGKTRSTLLATEGFEIRAAVTAF